MSDRGGDVPRDVSFDVDDEDGFAGLDSVARVQSHEFRHRRAVELGAVGAAEVAEATGGAVGFQGKVQTRHPSVLRHAEFGPLGASHRKDLRRPQQGFSPRARSLNGFKYHSHRAARLRLTGVHFVRPPGRPTSSALSVID